MSFIAWVNWIWGLALADSARAGFRAVGGLDRMFAVRRSALGQQENLTYALILFGVAFLLSGLGLFLTASLRQRRTRLPIHLIAIVVLSGLTFGFYLLRG